MKNNLTISLIIPCYNEEVNIQKGVLDKIGNFAQDDPRFKEVLIIDDGSTDASRELIKRKYLSRFSKFKLIENPHQGKAAAVITGIQKAVSPYVIFSDIDLATPIEEADKLIEEAKRGFRIVIGSRNDRRRGAPVLRKVMAMGSIIVKDFVIGIKGVHDTQCGFKLFEKKAAQEIMRSLIIFHTQKKIKGSSVSAAFDMEFLFIAFKKKIPIKEVSVAWRHVETKNVNFLKDSLETLLDIARLKYYDLLGRYR